MEEQINKTAHSSVMRTHIRCHDKNLIFQKWW